MNPEHTLNLVIHDKAIKSVNSFFVKTEKLSIVLIIQSLAKTKFQYKFTDIDLSLDPI